MTPLIRSLTIASALLLLTQHAPAGEGQPLLELLQRAVGRSVLASREGERLADALRLPHPGHRTYRAASEIVTAYDDLAAGVARELSRPELAVHSERLSREIRTIEADLADLRRIRRIDRPERPAPSDPAVLSESERELVRILSGDRLGRPVTELAETLSAAGEIRFSPAPRAGNTYRSNARDFREGRIGAEDPLQPRLRGDDRATMPEAAITRERARTQGWYRRLKECLRTQPPSAERRGFIRYLMEDLGLTLGLSASTYVVGLGLDHVDWSQASTDAGLLERAGLLIETGYDHIDTRDFTTDMIVSAFFSVLGNFLLRGGGPELSWFRRWVRFTGLGLGRAGIEATVYQLNPVPGNGSAPGWGDSPEQRLESGLTRFGFNGGWALGTTWVGVFMYEITQGLLCQANRGDFSPIVAKMVGPGTFMFRLVQRGSMSVGYYYLRSRTIGHPRDRGADRPDGYFQVP